MNAFRLPSQLMEFRAPIEQHHLEHMQSMFDKEDTQSYAQVNPGELWYARYRRVLVDWIAERVTGQPLNLTNLTTHSAVYYMDRVLSSFQLPAHRLQLVACACILIAAKMEERDEDFPHLSDLRDATDGMYSDELIFQMELEILNLFSWRTCIVTSLHFIGHFMPFAHTPDDDRIDGVLIPSSGNVLSHIEKYAEFFADFCLQDNEFCRYKHSQLAAGCIWSARRALEITPFWSPLLAHYTTYNWEELQGCAQHIWHCYVRTFPDHARASSRHRQQQQNQQQVEQSPTNVLQASTAMSSSSTSSPSDPSAGSSSSSFSKPQKVDHQN